MYSTHESTLALGCFHLAHTKAALLQNWQWGSTAMHAAVSIVSATLTNQSFYLLHNLLQPTFGTINSGRHTRTHML